MRESGRATTRPAEILPSFRPVNGSPRLPDAVGTIAIAAGPPALSPDGPTWPLWGSFRVSLSDGAGESALKRIVLALTSGASHVTQARHACTDALVFRGDVACNGNEVSGYFNLNLAELFELPNRQETFHLVASIGAVTSEVVTFAAEFPWIDWPQPGVRDAERADEGDDEGDEDGAADDDSWMIDDPD